MTAMFIKLNAINLKAEEEMENAAQVATSYFEEDDLERPVVVPFPTATETAVPTFPITVNVEQIRAVHPRKDGSAATRVVFENGAAEIINEAFEPLSLKLAAVAGMFRLFKAIDSRRETEFPIAINVQQIRDVHPRREKPGTRLVYKNGSAELLSDDYEVVSEAIIATASPINS